MFSVTGTGIYSSLTETEIVPVLKCCFMKVADEWLAPLLLIRELPGSNLGPEAGDPD
jgi:hypothetical protein